MRAVMLTLLPVGLATLGCTSMNVADMKQDLNKEITGTIRTTLIDSCSQGGDTKQRKICTCAVDELVTTKTPQELADLAKDPKLALEPLLDKCGKLLFH